MNSELFYKRYPYSIYLDIFANKKKAIYEAVKKGRLECLKYCTENGYKKYSDATLKAAQNGHLNCLKYCTENGYEKDEESTFVAAENGHLECL